MGGRAFGAAPFHASMPSRLFHTAAMPGSPNHGRSAFREFGRRGYGLVLPYGGYGYGYPYDDYWPQGGYDLNLPPRDIGYGNPPLYGCMTIDCTYYDPSASTYVDPYDHRRVRNPNGAQGVAEPARSARRCNEEVTIHPEDQPERTINILRC